MNLRVHASTSGHPALTREKILNSKFYRNCYPCIERHTKVIGRPVLAAETITLMTMGFVFRRTK